MMNDKVGAGVYIPDPVGNGSPIEMSYHIGERSTVFQAETFAVEQAAKQRHNELNYRDKL